MLYGAADYASCHVFSVIYFTDYNKNLTRDRSDSKVICVDWMGEVEILVGALQFFFFYEIFNTLFIYLFLLFSLYCIVHCLFLLYRKACFYFMLSLYLIL
jgi:hypothetical protein